MSFWAIDTEAEAASDGTKSAHGPFETRKAAEEFIRRDFTAWWLASELPLGSRDRNVAGTWLLVEQLAEVRPVGMASLKVTLEQEGAK